MHGHNNNTSATEPQRQAECGAPFLALAGLGHAFNLNVLNRRGGSGGIEWNEHETGPDKLVSKHSTNRESSENLF